jgi:hypothetical protein
MIPFYFALKAMFAIYALLIGIKPSGIDWEDFKNLGDPRLDVYYRHSYNFFLSPLAMIIYFLTILLVITQQLNPNAIIIALAIILLCNFYNILNYFKRHHNRTNNSRKAEEIYTEPENTFLQGKSKKSLWMIFKIIYSRAKKPLCKPIIKK